MGGLPSLREVTIIGDPRTWPIRPRVATIAVVVAGLVLAGCAGAPASTRSRSTAAASKTVPAGFVPVSVTFVSARIGWVLGVVPARTGTRLAVARTADGGTSWSRSPAPPVTLGTVGVASDSLIRFADPRDGWIAAPRSGSAEVFPSTLWSTHDGGATWHQVAVPGGGQVAALEAADGVFDLVTMLSRELPAMNLYAVRATHDRWGTSTVSLPLGAGPVPSAQLALQGASGWLVEDDRIVVAGARLTAGRWTTWTPPCTDANGPAFVAASSATDLVAVCDEGLWGNPAPGTTAGQSWLFTSGDAGTEFTAAGAITTPVPSGGYASVVATPPGEPHVVVVGGSGLTATFDGGHTWTTVSTLAAGQTIRFVGFTTATQGIAIASGFDGSTLLMTRDGGSSWNVVVLSGTKK